MTECSHDDDSLLRNECVDASNLEPFEQVTSVTLRVVIYDTQHDVDSKHEYVLLSASETLRLRP